MTTEIKRILTRRGDTNAWTANDATLTLGELGYETAKKQLRMGDGVTPFSGLPSLAYEDFASISDLAASKFLKDGSTYRIIGTGETFQYNAASTLTADGALVVTPTGMGGVGRLISTRTSFPTVAAMLADNRTFADSTALNAGSYTYTAVSSGDHPENAGGQKLKPSPFIEGKYHVAQVGALGGATDVTVAVAQLIGAMPDGAELHLDGSKTYTLTIDTDKSIKLMGNGATLTPADDTKNGILIAPDPADITNHAVVEVTLPYGSTTFQVVGASGLFSAGDIGVLHDEAQRPFDNQHVNYLAVKIAAVSGDTVTVEGYTRSYMGAGPITFRHSTNQIKNVGVFDLTVSMPASNVNKGIFITDVENVQYDNINTSGTLGTGLAFRFCHGVDGGTYRGRDVRGLGSGQGYGLQFMGVSEVNIGPTFGDGMRHVFDADSVYGGTIGMVYETNAISSPLTFAHNGFAGHITFAGFQGICNTGAYPIGSNSQGYGTGANRALKANHFFRNIVIGRNDVTMRGLDPNAFAVLTYFQNGVIDCDPGVLAFRMEDQTALGASAASIAVRVNGPVIGSFPISVSGDRIGYAFFRADDDGYTGKQGVMDLRAVQLDECRMVGFVRGGGTFKAGPASVKTMRAEPIYQCDTISGNKLDFIDIAVPSYDATARQIVATNSMVFGTMGLSQKASTSAITSPNGRDVTAAEIQNRSGFMRIIGDTGAGTDTLNSFADPSFNGQRVTILGYAAGRKDVVIPNSAGTTGPITFDVTSQVRTLVAYNGKWTVT